MKTMFVILIACVACKPGAKDPDKDKPAQSSSADEHEGIPRKLKVSPNVVRDAKIQTSPARKQALKITIALPGEIASDPDKTARISSPVAGRIDQVLFKDAAMVKKGETLALIRVTELSKVRAAYTEATSKAKAARSNADRTKALWEQRLASEQNYLDTKAAADALDAEVRSLGEQLTAIGAGSGGTPFQLALKAPLSGVVLSRDAVVGQPITADQVVGTVADLSEVWFVARAFEKDLGLIRIGASAEVQLNAYSKERFSGRVESLGRQIDPVARTITARIRLTNRDDLLRIGLFGTAHVETEEEEKHEALIVLPRGAVTDVAGKSVVFVRGSGDVYDLHQVTLGDAALGKVEIVSGVREGEDVVVEGVFTLKSLVLKSASEEE